MSSSSTKQDLDVAIVGGGIAGLCLAIGLLKHNISVTIYESAHHFGEIGAGVFFGPSAIRAMNGIDPGIKAGFDKVATSNMYPEQKDTWFNFRYGEDHLSNDKNCGDLICAAKCSWAITDGQGGVHRARFLEELVKLVPENIAHFGKRVTEISSMEDGRSQLIFKDGTEATHGCVIGCDGVHSQTRKYILGPDDPAAIAVFSGKYCHRGLIPMDEAIKALGEDLAVNSEAYVGRHSHLLTFPVEQGKIYNAVAFSSCPVWDFDKTTVSGNSKDINEDFKQFGEPVQKIINLMCDTDIWALFDHPAARTYYKGKVAIIGDAAHATTPHQGSGAGMAIEDAYVMSSLLGNVTTADQVEACFKAFDLVRRERTQKLVTTSREAGEMWELEYKDVGEDFEMFKHNVNKRMDWIWNEDLDAEITEGIEMLQG